MNKLQAAIVAGFFALQSVSTAWADGDVELVETMSTLQYFAHKTALAIDHKNKPLTEFYAHELEEFLEEAAAIKTYDGFPVGDMVKKMSLPTFEKFEAAIESDNWKNVSKRFDEVINTCNSCHTATDHGFITIERRSDNPFMQSFGAVKR